MRDLAGRAGGAAKEIKELITRSGAEVGAGVKLVQATGEALGEIERRVVDVNGAVAAIPARPARFLVSGFRCYGAVMPADRVAMAASPA